MLPQGLTGEWRMPTDTGVPTPNTEPTPHRAHPTAVALSASCPSRPQLTCQLLPAASKPCSALAAPPFPQVARGRAPPKGGRCTPPPRPHPDQETKSGGGGRKPIPRRRGGQAPCPLHSVPGPGPQPPAPGAGTHPKPPCRCHLALHPFQSAQRGGTSPRVTQRAQESAAHCWVWGVRSHTPMVPPGSPRLRGYPTRVLSGTSPFARPFLGDPAGLGSLPRSLSEPVSFP